MTDQLCDLATTGSSVEPALVLAVLAIASGAMLVAIGLHRPRTSVPTLLIAVAIAGAVVAWVVPDRAGAATDASVPSSSSPASSDTSEPACADSTSTSTSTTSTT